MAKQQLDIAVLGGTGAQGSGLAYRWAAAGHRVVLGSRDAARAHEAALKLNTLLGADKVRGSDNQGAAASAQVVVLTVPYAAQRATALEVAAALQGKVLIDVTVPLVPPKVSLVQLPEGRSAVAALQQALGNGVRVVSAFQNVSSHHLKQLDYQVECDALVCSDDEPAAEVAIGLVRDAGLRGWYAGPLANSVVLEGMTSVLIGINRRYKIPAAGIRIVGVPGPDT